MKKHLLLVVMFSVLMSGCAGKAVVTPLPPTQTDVNALKSDYRKTVEVVQIQCFEKPTGNFVHTGNSRKANNTNSRNYIPETETISVVETTKTGERFEMYGCFGKPGDRFRISY